VRRGIGSMLARNPIRKTKRRQRANRRRTTQEEQRARGRLAVQEHRARERKHLGLYYVACGGDVLNLLVRRHYLTDCQVRDKRLVNRALSALLWDLANG
jgi:hypothetical protein